MHPECLEYVIGYLEEQFPDALRLEPARVRKELEQVRGRLADRPLSCAAAVEEIALVLRGERPGAGLAQHLLTLFTPAEVAYLFSLGIKRVIAGHPLPDGQDNP